jgi:quercetin dioxygenase-like cupin family protein
MKEVSMAQVQIIPNGLFPPKEQPAGVFQRNLTFTDSVMLFETKFKAGSEFRTHTHTNDQLGYVVKGEIEVVIEGKPHICRAGDSYAIPAGVVHTLHACTDAITIEAFSRQPEVVRR